MQDVLQKGLTHTSRLTVGREHTALAMGSGDMEVFATPAMVALMEHAAMLAVASSLPEGSTTVGARWIRHTCGRLPWGRKLKPAPSWWLSRDAN